MTSPAGPGRNGVGNGGLRPADERSVPGRNPGVADADSGRSDAPGPSTSFDPIGIGDLPPVPPMGFGTWQWGDRLFWGFGNEHDEDDAADVYRIALERGIRFFDTAEVYGAGLLSGLGRSEEILGGLHANQETSRASDVLVGTKFFPLPWRVAPGQLRRALDASIERLRMDAVDLYQLHWPFPPRSVETWANAMADAYEDGRVRAIGISNCDLAKMQRVQDVLSERGLSLASNQVEFSLLEREPQRSGLLEACQDMGVALIAYSPLAQGLLTGKYGPERPMSGLRGMRFHRVLGDLGPFLERIRDISDEVGATPAQLALAWAMAKGAFVIPGAKSAKQAEQNAAALQIELEDAHVAALDELSARAPGL